MFDIAWSEILVVIIVAALLISPKDLPHLLKFLKQCRRKLIILKSNVTNFFQALLAESDLHQQKHDLEMELQRLNAQLTSLLSARDSYVQAREVVKTQVEEIEKKPKRVRKVKKIEELRSEKDTIH
jgi:Sec-independent protein translocase protein TatA